MSQIWKSIASLSLLSNLTIHSHVGYPTFFYPVDFNLILFCTSLYPRKSKQNNFFFLFNHFSERIRRVLNFIQRIHMDNYRTLLISVLIILSVHSMPISNTLILFTIIIPIWYVRYLFNNLEIITTILLFF